MAEEALTNVLGFSRVGLELANHIIVNHHRELVRPMRLATDPFVAEGKFRGIIAAMFAT